MLHENPSEMHLSLTPLGAGDLIDRSVRFYRKNFWTFVWIAAPPVLVGMLISVGWMMLSQRLFSVGSSTGEGVVLGERVEVGLAVGEHA